MSIFWNLFCWLCLLGLAYIYAGYPLLIWLLSRMQRRPVFKQSMKLPVSIVIVAYNEAQQLPRKIANLLAMNDADSIREILIGLDGSTDDTVLRIREFDDPRLRVIEFGQRRGKPAVLNDLIPECQGEIVLLADVRQEFDQQVLTQLMENFADPGVGAVSGELVFRNPGVESAAAEGIGFYWKYEKFIRKCESAFRGVPGATGACYALRKSLFRPISSQLILDDVAIPMQAIEQGYRCVFESQAIAYDVPSQHSQQEAIRKRRTIAGVVQLMQVYPNWLVPGRHPLWFEFLSHKVLRLFSPLFLLGAFFSNVMLLDHSVYQVLWLLQCVFYSAGIAGWVCQQRRNQSKLFGAPLMFLTLNATTALALWDALRSRYRVTWQKSTEWEDSVQHRYAAS